MRFDLNGKVVNFENVLSLAKPLNQWTTGELRRLDRLGFVIVGRDLSRESLTYDDLFALVAYFAMRANSNIVPADIDRLSMEEFGKIAQAFAERFAPLLFPPAQEAVGETPFGNGTSTPAISSADSAAGDQT